MLAPMTNEQSHENGELSHDEFRWLQMRAEGGFGLTMTCASHVQQIGKGFSGQLGIFSDKLQEGHERLTRAIKAQDSLAVIQLHHAGMRSPESYIGTTPVCPSDNEKFGARALELSEIDTLREDFVEAAKRAQRWGYDGVEIHGAHGYILCQFLSAEINHRTDKYGGNLNNRSRLLFEIIEEIRTVCGNDFIIGVRLSPERFGMDLEEVQTVCRQLIASGHIDFLDISLWDVFKMPESEAHKAQPLLHYFTALERGDVQLTVAGKIRTARDVDAVLNQSVDFVTIGRSAILHHDFPQRILREADFEPVKTPVSSEYLKDQGLSEVFIQYMKKWPHFVEE